MFLLSCLYNKLQIEIMGVASHRHERSQFWGAIDQDNIKIFKQGQLIKESKYLKQWRNRTVLLIEHYIVTLQQDQVPPTAVIPLAKLFSLVKEDDLKQGYYLIKIITKDHEEFRFKTRQQDVRDDWFGKIKMEKIRILKQSKANSSLVEEQDNRLTFIQAEDENAVNA